MWSTQPKRFITNDSKMCRTFSQHLINMERDHRCRQWGLGRTTAHFLIESTNQLKTHFMASDFEFNAMKEHINRATAHWTLKIAVRSDSFMCTRWCFGSLGNNECENKCLRSLFKESAPATLKKSYTRKFRIFFVMKTKWSPWACTGFTHFQFTCVLWRLLSSTIDPGCLVNVSMQFQSYANWSTLAKSLSRDRFNLWVLGNRYKALNP